MDIIVLSAEGCGPCKTLKTLMVQRDIDYRELDARDQNNIEVAELLFRNRIKSVPALIIDGGLVGIGEEAIRFIEEGNLDK